MVAHSSREANQLFDSLTLGAQRRKQGHNRVLPGPPGKDLLHRAFGLLLRKMGSGFSLFNENLHHEASTVASQWAVAPGFTSPVRLFTNGIVCKYTWFLSLAR